VRCGPQAVHPSDVINGRASTTQTQRSSNSLFGQRSVTVNGRDVNRRNYYNQKLSTHNVQVPNGYAPAWNDDRLNPYRGHVTAAGNAQTNQIWQQTVPRRLNTNNAANLPDHSAQWQNNVVSRNVAPTSTINTAKVASQPTGKKRTRVANTGKVYVHVAYYNSRSDGHYVAQDLARAGVPANIAKVRKNGRYYTSVMAGPYQSRAQAQAVVGQIRAMGFANAALR